LKEQHLVCPACGAVNRVPVSRNAAFAKCGKCHTPLFEGHPAAATAASFAKHIQSNDIPVVVDFWAEWCGPCKMMAAVYERIAAALEPAFRFLKVDTESEPALAAQYNIRSIPTLMIFRRGTIVAQRVGAMDEQSLRNWLRAHA
jgi:thioredoxin 2